MQVVTTRIVVTGGECTGKTTLAMELATHLHARWLPEAARAYAEEAARAGTPLSPATVEPIARRHMDAEDAVELAPSGLLVLDTDLISTVTYARCYYGASATWIEDEARRRRGNLYLLCAPDVPWTPDGVRDRPLDREAMFERFSDVLREFGAPMGVVRGLGVSRMQNALEAIRTGLATLPDGAMRSP